VIKSLIAYRHWLHPPSPIRNITQEDVPGEHTTEIKRMPGLALRITNEILTDHGTGLPAAKCTEAVTQAVGLQSRKLRPLVTRVDEMTMFWHRADAAMGSSLANGC